jgi:TatA/E family protein of Tat protein translocase
LNRSVTAEKRGKAGAAMGSLGMQEIIIIFILALIIFGPRKLPELGKTLGKGLAEFKKASNELKQTWEDEVRLDKEKETMSEIIKDTTIQPSEILKDDENSSGPKESQ